MIAAVRRVRAHGGHFALLAALALVGALLLTATPRTANRLADDGLRAELAGLPWQARDVTYENARDEPPGGSGAAELDRLQQTMPAHLSRLVSERWYAAQIGPDGLRATGPDLLSEIRAPLDLGLRAMSGAQDAVRFDAGRWPADARRPGTPIEIAVSTAVARATGLRLGSAVTIQSPPSVVRATVVGLFHPIDPADGIWDGAPGVLRHIPSKADGAPDLAMALTTDATLTAPQSVEWPLQFSWRYRLDLERLDAGSVPGVVDALRAIKRTDPAALTIVTGLENALRDFRDTMRSVQAINVIVVTGVLASLAGLILLAARLAADRRAAEYRLIEARGAAARTLAGRTLAETMLVVPAAAALGTVVGMAAPGRAAATDWLVLAVVALAVLAPAVTVTLSRPAQSARPDQVARRTRWARRTVEAAVATTAVLGVVLLHRRGAQAGDAVDPLVISVPVLSALAAAMLAMRASRWPLLLAGRLAARTRGLLTFMGLAQAGRSRSATGPVLVLVLAATMTTFCAAVAVGLAESRDRAAAQAIPADFLLSGDGLAPDIADDLAAQPGVRAVATLSRRLNQVLYRTSGGTAGDVDEVQLLVVDGPTFARVVAESGVDVELPPAIVGAADRTGAVPAVASPAVAADAPEASYLAMAGTYREFRVASVLPTFPGLDRKAERFLVLPRQALSPQANAALVPSGYLIAGAGVDAKALRDLGTRFRREPADGAAAEGSDRRVGVSLIARTDYRSQLEQHGANGLVAFSFVVGVAGGGLLSVLAIAFAVLGGAHDRRRVLSRLSALGLSRRQWRGLLTYEFVPSLGLAVFTGTAVGLVLPALLAPALHLSVFTAGVPVPLRFDGRIVGAAVALGMLFSVAAIAMETRMSRRLHPGAALQLGEEG